MVRRAWLGMLVLALAGWAGAQIAAEPPVNPALFAGLHWRLIGPFRGGRSITAVGVPGHPSVYYFGAVGGGVWKTTDAGNTWRPIFDAEPIASIGAIAVAPSDPSIIYVGSGEADMRSDISYGDGVYKSTDGGKTWQHLGLTDTRQIGAIVVNPRNPNEVFVAALGHAYGPNAQRGVFRSTDGGRTWRKVLYKNPNVGAIDLSMDPRDPRIVYASLWQTRRPPWNVYPPSNGPGSGLYKSTDGGNTWTHLTAGLPVARLGRIGVAVAPSDPQRVYALVDAQKGGLYRSDNGGRSFRLVDNEARIWGRGWYFGGVTVDAQNPDIVYIANTSTYRSTNGGRSFTAIKGAPGGDDYHSVWVAPDHPNHIILASDQGVVISLNDGRTWSSWYNQPTAQLYHISAGSRFAFWVYGAQQDSGAIAVKSRSHHGVISQRDWVPIGAGGESGYVVPDPLNPEILFGGTVTRYNRATGAAQYIPPTLGRSGAFRHTWTLPLVFSAADPHDLYFGNQYLFRTDDGGRSWARISPDLTRPDPGVPPNLGPVTARDVPPGEGPRRGVIYTIAPSPLRAREIWIGTDDGYIQLTRDGGRHWTDVTPPALTPWSKVTMIAASHFSPDTAFAAVDRHRLEDLRPYIYRTEDSGKTWTEITAGIPTGAYVNAIKEDPRQPGLLYSGTELGLYVSFDNGGHWQPLRLNMPVASVRDILVREDDLVVGTHGRSIWVLDDMSPLRHMAAAARAAAQGQVYLFPPATAYRVRPGSQEGTPLPPETPQAKNPPYGAVIDYYLPAAAQGPVTLEFLDARGQLVRRYSSAAHPPQINPNKLDIPAYWLHPPKILSAAAGMHRWVWDLHYPAPTSFSGPAFFAAFFGGGGPWAVPGRYTVKLTVDGQSYTRPLLVRMDPRVHVAPAALARQLALALAIGQAQKSVALATRQARALQARLAKTNSQTALAAQVAELLGSSARLGPDFSGEGGPSHDFTSLRAVDGALRLLARNVESYDAAPSPQALRAWSRDQQTLHAALGRWRQLQTAAQ
ncbi:MAG: WD40/YVTN/BNR-like repeat-containing protein [Terriglobales bacterium]